MNYEKFNDAMCKLRQAEEEFNRKLQEAFKPFIDEINRTNAQIDAKVETLQEKEERQVDLQEQINEAYNKGLEDARNAVLRLYENENWYKIFGSCYNFNILTDHSMAEIIEKENQLKAEKEKQAKEHDFHIGDEILVIDSDPNLNGRTFVIYEITDNSYYVIEPLTLYKDGFFKKAYIKNQIKKTGKHYDSIPLPKEMD